MDYIEEKIYIHSLSHKVSRWYFSLFYRYEYTTTNKKGTPGNVTITLIDLTNSNNQNKRVFAIFRIPSRIQHEVDTHSSMIHRFIYIPLSFKKLNRGVNIIKHNAVNAVGT